MDKYEFMGVVRENFEECDSWHDLKVRKTAMINVIENMFNLEMEYRKHLNEALQNPCEFKEN